VFGFAEGGGRRLLAGGPEKRLAACRNRAWCWPRPGTGFRTGNMRRRSCLGRREKERPAKAYGPIMTGPSSRDVREPRGPGEMSATAGPSGSPHSARPRRLPVSACGRIADDTELNSKRGRRRGIIEARTMTAPSFAEADEFTLVARSREGDGSAFGELVRRYEGKIFRLALHVTQNREDAEDVLQETFLKAHEHLDQFQGAAKFYTWIVRIAVNQALMKLRRRRTDRTVSLDEAIDTGEDTIVREVAAWDENPEQKFSRVELGGILDSAIQGLEPAYRSVFVLRDIDELSTEEAADALGLSIPAVKSRLLRARLQLREKLTRHFKRKGDDAFAYL